MELPYREDIGRYNPGHSLEEKQQCQELFRLTCQCSLLPDPATMAMTLLTPTENVLETWGGEGEVERILYGLDVVSELDEAFMFRQPVDLEEEPMYCLAVPFPTDLSTIRERLQNQFYRFVIKLVVNRLFMATPSLPYLVLVSYPDPTLSRGGTVW